MILVLKSSADDRQIQEVADRLAGLGLESQVLRSFDSVLIAVLSDARTLPGHLFSQLDAVEKIIRVQPRCPLAAAGKQNHPTKLRFSDPRMELSLGEGAAPVIIAGPCSVESESQVVDIAHKVKAAGATALRGGAFKPRTSPYDFSGLGEEALAHLAEASRQTGLPIVSEVLSASQVEQAFDCVDIYQVGARNMYNYELLREIGRTSKPVLLKRAMSATIDELLQAAEYILNSGNSQVILCERGIRTFETRTRNTLDLSAVAILKSLTNLPVVVDPSHATGKKELIRPMSRAAIACGADGLLIEVHTNPERSISDSAQAITPAELARISTDAATIYGALNDGAELAPALTGTRTLASRSF